MPDNENILLEEESEITNFISEIDLLGTVFGIEAITVQDDSLTTAKYKDESVTNEKLADEAVTFGKIADGVLPYVTPEMFGAKGDGVTDDTAAIQATLNKGGLIIFGAGKSYLVSDVLRIKKNSELDLNGCTITTSYVHGFYNFEQSDVFLGYDGNGNIVVKNGVLVGFSVSFIHAENVLFDNVDMRNTLHNHYFEICACKDFTIRNCSLVGMPDSQTGNTEYINLDHCVYENFPWLEEESATYDGTPNKNIYVTECLVSIGGTGYTNMLCGMGVHSNMMSEPLMENVNFINNVIIGASDRGFSLLNCTKSRANGNYVESSLIMCWLGGGDHNEVKNNTLVSTAVASSLPVGVYENFTNLTFLGNSFKYRDEISETLIYKKHFNYVSNAASSNCTFAKVQETLLIQSSAANGFTGKLAVPFSNLNQIEISTGTVGEGNYYTFLVRSYSTRGFKAGEVYRFGDNRQYSITFSSTDPAEVTVTGYVRALFGKNE